MKKNVLNKKSIIILIISIILSSSILFTASAYFIDDKKDKSSGNIISINPNDLLVEDDSTFDDKVSEEPEFMEVLTIYEQAPMTLKEAYEDSILVADVTVVENLGICSVTPTTSVFRVKVNKTFQGSLPEEIFIKQFGSEEVIVTHYPLFQKGNRMLLILNKCDYEKQNEKTLAINEIDFNNLYSIKGTRSILDIYEKNGSLYILDRYGTNSAMELDGKKISNIKNSNTDVLNDFLNSNKKIAQSKNSGEMSYSSIFNYNDLIIKFKK